MNALFRAIGAASSNIEVASKLSGVSMKFLVMYTGYMIPKPNIRNWFVEFYYANPLAYAFQAGLTNEFHDTTMPCVGTSLVPSGSGYNDPRYQSCSGVAGAEKGATYVTGDNYLAALHYKHSQMWRNFGVVWGWWAFGVGLAILATCMWRTQNAGSNVLLIPREKMSHFQGPKDEETPPTQEKQHGNSPIPGDDNHNEPNLVRNTSVFTWKNLSYTVKTPSGDRVLLNDIYGWVKPGMLGALMGSSGAGKTTLLDVLAQRKTEGTIRGSVLVDGRELPLSFQRMAGYCEQLDVHEPYATVREALEFSALLRQSEVVPREEKLAYVDTIIDLLELHDLADTLIGTVGEGLSVEQRKRVTIGVELVSKPKILIFLDEPTSGLDGQSAFNTVRFLRRLADAGQAILVTIHQPSAQLFSQFDTLLLLARGGKMVYFGDIGDNACTIRDYFSRYGAPCPIQNNPAEHMIDVVTGGIEAVKDKDWHTVWLESPENAARLEELDLIVSESAAKPEAESDDREFATSLWTQIKIVTGRMSISLLRNTDYVNNKLELHIISAFLNGFSFWHLGSAVSDLQLKLFTIFNFTFVAPGVINQLQPLFIQRRDIYDAREKKSRMYSWKAFVTGLIVSEFPYLCLCAVLYFICWYYQTKLPHASKDAGATFFIMLIYEFIYTGIGQFIAAYAPNATFAALVNPLVVNCLVLFCGALVPQPELNVFWKYWMYYLNPFTYVLGGMLTFGIWDSKVNCKPSELAYFDSVNGTCASYLKDYMATAAGSAINLLNPDATSQCEVCKYSHGSDFLKGLNIKHHYYGWRNAGICVIFAISGYALVFGMMKLRTKASKRAE